MAGLVCARQLQREGVAVQVFEASDAVGGRVRTDEVTTPDGRFLLDRGFQILIDSYPEVRQQLNLRALELRAYAPGAVLARKGTHRIVADPTRRPQYLVQTLLTGIAGLAGLWDLFLLLRLRIGHFLSEPYEAFKRAPKTTEAFLRDLGLSAGIVDGFLRPFFEAIYVSPLSEQSSAQFEFVLRMLADGQACLPARGMRAIPEQLSEGLDVRLSAPVKAVRPKALQLENADEAWLSFDAVVVAAEWPAASRLVPGVSAACGTRSATWCFSLPSPPPVAEPLIILNTEKRAPGAGACLVNVGFSSLVQRSYAPKGRELAAVTVRGSVVDEAWVRQQLGELLGCDVTAWQLLRVYDLPFHQPAQVPLGVPEEAPTEKDGVVLCGDYTANPTLDGAMRSGRRAATAILQSL